MQSSKSARNLLTLLIFVGIVALMDYALLSYLASHGLDAKSYPVQIGSYALSLPLLGLTFVGVLIVAIAAWQYMSSTMPVTGLKEMGQLETIRVVRAAGIALFFFSLVLFGPYVVGASAFWAQMSGLSRSIPQLAPPLQGLVSSVRHWMDLDALTKFAVSQDAAAAALVLASGLIGYVQRRTRRVR